MQQILLQRRHLALSAFSDTFAANRGPVLLSLGAIDHFPQICSLAPFIHFAASFSSNFTF